jgi:hypothetical protein
MRSADCRKGAVFLRNREQRLVWTIEVALPAAALDTRKSGACHKSY